MLELLVNFAFMLCCANVFILPCCIIELTVEKIKDNKKKAKKRAEIIAWFKEEEYY